MFKTYPEEPFSGERKEFQSSLKQENEAKLPILSWTNWLLKIEILTFVKQSHLMGMKLSMSPPTMKVKELLRPSTVTMKLLSVKVYAGIVNYQISHSYN